MSKTITIRLEDSDYRQIALAAQHEHRPISNFITHTVLNALASVNLADDKEMKEIFSDPKLMARLKRGHTNAVSRKGRFVE